MPIKDEQTTNKQHAVPQNIMDVEFKIIGDLTMRQFFYLMVFFGISYGAFVFFRESIFRWPVSLISGGVGVLLAFVPVEDRGLDQWIVSFFKAIYSPTQRIWEKLPELTPAFSYQSISLVKQELITLAPTSSRRKLEEYLEASSKEGKRDPLDIPEAAYIEKVHDAFAQIREEEARTFVVTEEPKPEAETIVDLPKEPPRIETRYEPAAQEQLIFKQTAPLTPLTPDRHSGRRFTSLLPSEGEIVLPIARGERVLKTPAEESIETDIKDKAQQLKQLLEQIKQDEKYRGVITPLPPPAKRQKEEKAVSIEAQDVIHKIKEENKKLSQEIGRLKSEIDRRQTPQEKSQAETTLRELESKKSQAYADYIELRERVKQLEEGLREKGVAVKAAPAARRATITDRPNIASGVVMDKGGIAIIGAVIIIKNQKGDPVRAQKTNQLGQFLISAPLDNGSYTAEVANAPALGLEYNALGFQATGSLISALEFTPK